MSCLLEPWGEGKRWVHWCMDETCPVAFFLLLPSLGFLVGGDRDERWGAESCSISSGTEERCNRGRNETANEEGGMDGN